MKQKRQKAEIEIKQVSWHRNGVCGVGFYAILFEDRENGLMFAALYDEPGYCSVVRVDYLSDPEKGVTFGVNSWRGDHFEDQLRKLIKEQKDSNRVGPFSVIPLANILKAN